MFTLENVGKYYLDGKQQRWILQDLTFDFSGSRYIGIEGPSGSGKTTLLSLLCGLVVADAGTITFRDESLEFKLTSASAKQLRLFRRQHVGFIYQFFNLIPTLTAAENALLPLELTNQSSLKESAISRLESLGLQDRINAFPSELSGGEQQRLAVARAFAHEPKVILADEPTGNLDRNTAGQVINLLWEQTLQADSTLIVASHDPQVIERCDLTFGLAV